MRQPLVQSLPRVDIIYAHADDDGIFVKAAMEAGAKGIIHAGTGHGSISYAVEAALYEAAKNGCIVVRASRVVTGAVLNGHQRWQDAGFIPSRALSVGPEKPNPFTALDPSLWTGCEKNCGWF